MVTPKFFTEGEALRHLIGLRKIMYALGFLRVVGAQFEIPVEIVRLADKRWAAKQAKDWAGADTLRKELTSAGWSMLDGKDGYKLEPVKK